MKRIHAAVGSALLVFCSLLGHAQITPSQDSYTNTADPAINYGAKTLLDVEGATQVSYIQFNLASIPSGASVSQATLKLYVNAVSTVGSFNVDYVNGTWAESTITSNMAPALGTTIAASVALTTADTNQYILIDITPAVQAWLSGSEANDGIALAANGTFNATFDSKESTTTSHPPELDIVFAGGIAGLTTAAGSGLMGGGTSGTLNLGLLSTCSSGQVLQWNGSAWACATGKGTGTITGVTAGTDLTGGGASGSVTLNLDITKVPLLAANNTFTGTQTINNTTAITGSNVTALQVTNSAASGATVGVLGTASSPGGYGVQGISPNVGLYGSGTGSGGIGVDGHGTFQGVKGVATSTTGSATGVYGQTSSASSYGVEGTGPGAGVAGVGSLFGVVGNSTEGSGVYGFDSSSSGYGIQGQSSNVGVYGTSNGSSATGTTKGTEAGIWGDTGGSDDSSSAVLGTADGKVAGHFINNAPSNSLGNAWPTILASNLGVGSNGSIVLWAEGNGGQCNINGSGDLTCSGKVTAVVSADNGARKISLHAVQSTENWFEDAGSGQLSNGSVHIALDSTFAQTVNTSVEYHVFLTPNGDCKGLYVSQKSATSFEVRELGGGTSSIAFDYRIMAKRAGYEKERLEDVTQQYQEMAQQQRLREEHLEQRRRK